MPSEDIQKIRKILKYWKRGDLAELLKDSNSNVDESDQYGTYLFSTLSSFVILSSSENNEKLKNL